MEKHCYTHLIQIFNGLFQDSHETVLQKGIDEPIYLPKDDESPFHRVVFAHGFFSSALHEIAHWCIAGEKRRQLVDFGYWYQPDGRTEEQQRDFEQVEVKPQALEWLFTAATGKRFVISADNLNGDSGDDSQFKKDVVGQVHDYLSNGLPQRANQFFLALKRFYQVDVDFQSDHFQLTDLYL